MDSIGWFIATLHQMIGHDKTAVVIGALPGSQDKCLICRYEREPTDENRQALIRALAPPETSD